MDRATYKGNSKESEVIFIKFNIKNLILKTFKLIENSLNLTLTVPAKKHKYIMSLCIGDRMNPFRYVDNMKYQ